MRVVILAFLLLLCLPSKPGTSDSRHKLLVDRVNVNEYYFYYNASKFGDECNVAMFADACISRGWDPNHLSRVIEYESQYKTTARNNKSSATGLIQFMPSTARGLGTSVSKINTMSFEDQLILTLEYLDNVEAMYAPIDDSIDMYLAVFHPLSMQRREQGARTFLRRGSPAYNLNTVNDLNHDGDIDEWDIGRLMRYDTSLVDTVKILRKIRYVQRMPIKDFEHDLGL